MPLRVIMIEDQQLFRESIAALLRTRLGAEIKAVFSTAAETVQKPEVLREADVALVDVRLADTEAFDMVTELRRLAPGLKLIWVTSIEEDYLLQRAFEAGLPGFIHKEDSVDVLITAVERVAAGGTYISKSIDKLRHDLKAKPDYFSRILSPREQEVLRFIGAGFSNEEAASMLGLSAGTIQAHRRNIMARIDVHSASELQAYALRHGFTSPKSLKMPKK